MSQCVMRGMAFEIKTAESVDETVTYLKTHDQPRWKKVMKTYNFLSENPLHPGLNSHPFEDLDQVFGERIWESYIENQTPSAWRVWWFYGPEDGQISIVKIARHP